MAIFGDELAESIASQIEKIRDIVHDRERRIESCETDYSDCFISARLDAQEIRECQMKLEILKGDGLMDFEAVFDENGKEVGVHWFRNQWRRMTCVGRGVFASSLKALCKKTGWTIKKIRVPAWVKYECSGCGLVGALSSSAIIVRWHTNMVTGEYVGYPDSK